MPTGILQPGGPGTEIFVYDHLNGAADPVNGYDLLEIFAAANALDPGNYEELKGPVSGLPWGGARRQFLIGVRVTIGGQNADGVLATWLKGTNVDLNFRTGGSLNYRVAGYSNALFRTKFGTRVAVEYGSFKQVSGYDGVDIMSRTAQVIRGQQFLYGSEIYTDSGAIQFSDTGGAGFSEIAGCVFRTPSSFVIGNNTTPMLDVFNSTFASTTVGTMITAMSVRDSDNPIFAAATPGSFFASAAIVMKLSNAQFIGAPTISDLRWAGGGTGWILFCPAFSDTVGIPRFSGAAGPPLATPAQEHWYFNVKVGNQDGAPIMNVPVMITADFDGVVVDTKTFGDGDVGFVNGISGIENAVRVRDHFISGGVYAVRDRTFTCRVNGYGGLYPPLPGYETREFKFQWPGRDVFRGAYLLSGGSFKRCIMPVMLRNGSPSTSVILEECSL